MQRNTTRSSNESNDNSNEDAERVEDQTYDKFLTVHRETKLTQKSLNFRKQWNEGKIKKVEEWTLQICQRSLDLKQWRRKNWWAKNEEDSWAFSSQNFDKENR